MCEEHPPDYDMIPLLTKESDIDSKTIQVIVDKQDDIQTDHMKNKKNKKFHGSEIFYSGLVCVGIIILNIFVNELISTVPVDGVNTNATIKDLNINNYTCYHQVNCEKCLHEIDNPFCFDMIINNQTGTCRGAGMCCQPSHDETYCYGWNPSPRCKVIKNECYNPTYTVSYTVKLNITIDKVYDTSCNSLTSDICLNNFIGDKKNGLVFPIYYDVHNNEKYTIGIYRGHNGIRTVKYPLLGIAGLSSLLWLGFIFIVYTCIGVNMIITKCEVLMKCEV